MTLEDEAKYALSASRFAREMLGFTPDAKQTLALDAPSKRVVLNCTRQWGKSTVTAAKAVHRAFTQPKSLIVVTAPAGRQSAEFVLKASQFMDELGVRVRGDGYNRVSLLFPNGSRIVGLPGGKGKVRGYSAVSLLLVDEAAELPDEAYYRLRPMLAVSDGDLWVMSTPQGRQGFFWHEWASGDERWFRLSATAEECPRISHAFLDEERERLPEDVFRREYMCEFTQAEGALFREEDVLACFSDDVPPLVVR